MEECVHLQARMLGISHPHTLSSCTTLIGWQTKKLEIDALGAKNPASNDMISHME